MVREVAAHDFDKAAIVATWPLVEVLHAYRAKVRAEALTSHQHATTVWAVLSTIPTKGSKKPKQPKIPRILSDG